MLQWLEYLPARSLVQNKDPATSSRDQKSPGETKQLSLPKRPLGRNQLHIEACAAGTDPSLPETHLANCALDISGRAAAVGI